MQLFAIGTRKEKRQDTWEKPKAEATGTGTTWKTLLLLLLLPSPLLTLLCHTLCHLACPAPLAASTASTDVGHYRFKTLSSYCRLIESECEPDPEPTALPICAKNASINHELSKKNCKTGKYRYMYIFYQLNDNTWVIDNTVLRNECHK